MPCHERRRRLPFLINTSPDLRQQIEARPILHPRRDR
jgi:hypothetical protein